MTVISAQFDKFAEIDWLTDVMMRANTLTNGYAAYGALKYSVNGPDGLKVSARIMKRLADKRESGTLYDPFDHAANLLTDIGLQHPNMIWAVARMLPAKHLGLMQKLFVAHVDNTALASSDKDMMKKLVANAMPPQRRIRHEVYTLEDNHKARAGLIVAAASKVFPTVQLQNDQPYHNAGYKAHFVDFLPVKP